MNNIEGKCIENKRLSLWQGDVPSMFFFAYGIDPLITYLDRRLPGILICSLPVHGPVLKSSSSPTLQRLKERSWVVSYADIMEEFSLVTDASANY